MKHSCSVWTEQIFWQPNLSSSAINRANNITEQAADIHSSLFVPLFNRITKCNLYPKEMFSALNQNLSNMLHLTSPTETNHQIPPTQIQTEQDKRISDQIEHQNQIFNRPDSYS